MWLYYSSQADEHHPCTSNYCFRSYSPYPDVHLSNRQSLICRLPAKFPMYVLAKKQDCTSTPYRPSKHQRYSYRALEPVCQGLSMSPYATGSNSYNPFHINQIRRSQQPRRCCYLLYSCADMMTRRQSVLPKLIFPLRASSLPRQIYNKR